MDNGLYRFEKIARKSYQFTDLDAENLRGRHPFDERNIYDNFPQKVRELFDDSHYPQATFEAFKFIDKKIQSLSNSSKSGFQLMMDVLSEASPVVALTPCTSTSEKNEQKGFQFLFAGSILVIRNPRGHEYTIIDSPDLCLDHLSLASMLLRRLEQAGFTI